MLKVALIQQHLSGGTVGRDIRLYATVASTNSVLRDLAKQGVGEGTVVIADEQTAGHGRLQKSWFSPPGVNVYASVLFRPAIPLREVPGFSFISSLALADAIALEGLQPAIKWPNDVLIDRKKVAGSLVECASTGRKVEYVILGVGVNVNVKADALRAALGDAARAADSLGAAAGREIDRNVFAANFLNLLDKWAGVFTEKGPAPLLEAWRDRDILTGRRAQVRGEGETYDGRVLGVDREGYLMLRSPRGARRRVLTGEVRIAD